MAGREPPQPNHFSGHSNYVPPVQHQEHDHLQHSAEMLPAWGNGQFDGEWERRPLAAGNGGATAAQGTTQDPHHFDVENHDMVLNYPPPPGDPAVQHMYPNGGFVQGPPEHEQVNFIENQRNGYAPQGIEPGFVQAGFPDIPAHQAPIFGQPARENLRQLVTRYVLYRGSEVDMVQMEPGFIAGRYRVVIVLDMADFP